MKPKQCSTVPKQLTLMNLFFLMNLSMTQVNLQLRFDGSLTDWISWSGSWFSIWLTQPQVISFDHIQLEMNQELLLCWSQHEMKILPIYFSKCVLSILLRIIHLRFFFYLVIYNQNVISLYSSEITYFSLVTFARPFQSFNPLKTSAFLTIDCIQISLHPFNNWCTALFLFR